MPPEENATTSTTGAGPLARRLHAARAQALVGRRRECEVFRRALDDPGAVALLWVHGPGGIGKSTLTRLWAQEARAAGRTVVELDGHFIGPSPQDFEDAAAALLQQPGAVLVVDTFEQCRWLEPWLRERFLPRSAPGALVVVSGRTAPEVEWSVDAGWATAMEVLELAALNVEESAALLAARGVRAEDVASRLAFAGGNPLVLSLTAAVPRGSGAEEQDWAPQAEVLAVLMTRLIGEVPSARHRRALEVAAQAWTTTEELLHAALTDEDVPALFQWLRELPFMESAPQGLFPHDAAREVLVADLRWRAPQAFEAVRESLLREHLRQARQAPESAMLEAMGRAIYLYRDVPIVRDMYAWSRQGGVYEDVMRPELLEHVAALAEQVEGAESAALVRFWYARQPAGFHVFRDTRTGDLVAFSAHLTLPAPPDPEEVAIDPVVAAAWRYSTQTRPARSGEHLAVTRFAVYPAAYEQPSPVLELNHWRGLVEAYRASGRAQGFLVYQDVEAWAARLGSAMADSGERAVVGGRTYGLFVSDWRLEPFEDWFAAVVRQQVPASVAGQGPSVPRQAQGARDVSQLRLEREEFDESVRLALRTWRHPEGFATNRLLDSALCRAGGEDAVVVLRAVVEEAVEGLRRDLAGVKAHAALVATYFSGAPTHEAAARRLGLPFGTYRRHLRFAVAGVCESLWERELQAR
ncbi:ATP-binding protein [Motilibacter aurantiacus]|uniref:ATP-binding protein n=1 Tax=Motilibacter aurantiacus TaxID=2714955 RepID=UPI00140774D6|nr:ATP-binding protein [Motilibacter aurantiacus]NHC45336.1 ATP-binding protein [Motilibacter aurantiacus]